MYCKKCGNKIDDESRYCDVCGVKVENPNNKFNFVDGNELDSLVNTDVGRDNLTNKKLVVILCGLLAVLLTLVIAIVVVRITG